MKTLTDEIVDDIVSGIALESELDTVVSFLITYLCSFDKSEDCSELIREVLSVHTEDTISFYVNHFIHEKYITPEGLLTDKAKERDLCLRLRTQYRT